MYIASVFAFITGILEIFPALERTGAMLLPGPALLPRTEGVVDVKEEESDTEEGMEEEERSEGAVPSAH